jgi:endonuclease YncB( thermonuclease family)
MIELVRIQRVGCEPDGTTSYDRVVGVRYAAGQDVAAELLRRGLARDCPRYNGGRYRDLETASATGLSLPGYCEP